MQPAAPQIEPLDQVEPILLPKLGPPHARRIAVPGVEMIPATSAPLRSCLVVISLLASSAAVLAQVSLSADTTSTSGAVVVSVDESGELAVLAHPQLGRGLLP